MSRIPNFMKNNGKGQLVFAVPQRASNPYTGLLPIQVDNDKMEISIDLSDIASKEDLNKYFDKEIETTQQINSTIWLNDQKQIRFGASDGTTLWGQIYASPSYLYIDLQNGNGYINKAIDGDPLKGRIGGVRTPLEPDHIASKDYVDKGNEAMEELIATNSGAITKNTLDIKGLQAKNSFNIRGEYSATETYSILDLIFYDKPGGKVKWEIYVSKTNDNTGNTPEKDSEFWVLIGTTDTIFTTKEDFDAYVESNNLAIITIQTNFLDKTSTEKQFLAGDLNVKGKLQTTQKAEFNVDVLRLEDGNDLYIPKNGNSIFGTLIGESLSSGKLYNREVITSNMSGKTAINKEFFDTELAKKGNDWVQVLTPNQTTDGEIGSSQVFTLPDAVRDYSTFRVIGRSIANPKGQFQLTFVNIPSSYGKNIATGLYLGASNQWNEMKWINNSGNGSTGSIALYVDFAILEIQGKKR